MTDQSPTPNRRGFLRALGGAAAFAGFGQAFGQGRGTGLSLGKKATDTPTGLLNLAATAEALTVTLYHHALSAAEFQMDAGTREQLVFVLQAEQGHLGLLASLGGAPLARAFNLPADLHSDARSFAETALHLEQVCTGAYIAATHQFAEAGQPELAATAAQLGASEAQHLALLSHLAGFGPREVTLPQVPFRRLTDAPPVLAPFIGQASAAQVQVALPTPKALEAFGEVGRVSAAFSRKA